MIKKSSLGLIVPCYNESSSIPYFEEELNKFRDEFNAQMPEFCLSVFVIDNGSTDGSHSMLKELENRTEDLKLLSCPTIGYGAALKHGFSNIESDYLCFLDLDNTYPMISFVQMLRKLISDDLDIIYGARIHDESGIPFIRYLGNQLYVVLMKFLFHSPLTDVCSGMRIFKSIHKYEIINLKSDDLSFSIDFTALVFLKKWKVSELPISYRERVGDSKLSVIKDGFLFLSIIFKNYFRGK